MINEEEICKVTNYRSPLQLITVKTAVDLSYSIQKLLTKCKI